MKCVVICGFSKTSDSIRTIYSEHICMALELIHRNNIEFFWEPVRMLLCRDPQTDDEMEYLENMFDALCSCMLLPENRAKVVEVIVYCVQGSSWVES